MFGGMHGALDAKLAVLVLKALCKLLEILTFFKERLRNIRARGEAAAAVVEVMTTAEKEKEKKG